MFGRTINLGTRGRRIWVHDVGISAGRFDRRGFENYILDDRGYGSLQEALNFRHGDDSLVNLGPDNGFRANASSGVKRGRIAGEGNHINGVHGWNLNRSFRIEVSSGGHDVRTVIAAGGKGGIEIRSGEKVVVENGSAGAFGIRQNRCVNF